MITFSRSWRPELNISMVYMLTAIALFTKVTAPIQSLDCFLLMLSPSSRRREQKQSIT